MLAGIAARSQKAATFGFSPAPGVLERASLMVLETALGVGRAGAGRVGTRVLYGAALVSRR